MSKKSKPRKVEQQEAPREPQKDAQPIVESTPKEPSKEGVVAVTEHVQPSTEAAKLVEIETEVDQPSTIIATPTLDEQLLTIYNTSPPGIISLAHAMVELSIDDPILIRQAWDRLYDQHKVPFTKLYKPPPGRVGIDE